MGRCTALVANCNYGRYIEDCIDALLQQTYPCKIAICDDNSTDNSWEIITSYIEDGVLTTQKDSIILQNDKFLAIKLNTTCGPSHARNLLIQHTINDTDYYLVADADDIPNKTKVEKFVSVLEKYQHIGIVYADYDIFNVENNNLVRDFKEPFSHPRLLQECIIHSNAMIRTNSLKECMENTGWYDFRLRCAEDYDLWLRICDKYLAYHIAESLTLVRTHNNNSSNSVKKEIWQQCWQLVQQKCQERYAKP